MNSTQPTAPDVPGHRVRSIIGVGATSVVWSGADAVGRPVAIKVPHDRPDVVDRVQGEIERHVLMAVRHDHLVPLRDVVHLEDGRVALVFDLVEGTRLGAMVAARGHLRPGEAVTVLTPICDAIAALHAAGGTHGDLTASNIMVTSDGRPLVLDLGAARLAGTGAGVVLGTPGFTAPEVRAGARPDEASDVFSLGALAWLCLTGNGAPDTDLRLDPETVRSHVGPELAGVVSACIDPDPGARPDSAQLARMFFDAAPAEPIEVVVGADDASALTHRLRADAAKDPDHESPQGRPVSRAQMLAASAIGVAVVVAIAWAFLGRPAAVAGQTSGSSARPQISTSASPLAGSGTRPTGNSAAPTPSRAPGASTGADSVMDPQAASTRAAELMQALSDRRAAALMARDTIALGGIHQRNSPSWQSDAQLIAALQAGGNRYAGLRLKVARAATVTASGERATVRARVDWTAYDVIGPGGREHRSEASGDLLDFDLVRQPGGWRIVLISAAPAS